MTQFSLREAKTMCGRMVLTHNVNEIAEVFDAVDCSVESRSADAWSDVPRYNVAPGSYVPVVRSQEGKRSLAPLHWGLIPSWSKDRKIAFKLINARSETAAEKPSFRDALKQRRCIVPADAFYEWAPRPDDVPKKTPKRPHLFRRRDLAMIAIAGLWESWHDAKADVWIQSVTLLTTSANSTVRSVHHRMPVLLDEHDWALWLDPKERVSEAILSMLAPTSPEVLETFEVGTQVNSARFDDPSCIERVG